MTVKAKGAKPVAWKVRAHRCWAIAITDLITYGTYATRGEARSEMVKRMGRPWKEIEARGYRSIRVLVTPLESKP